MQVNAPIDNLTDSGRLNFDATGKIYGVVPAIVKKIHDPDQQRHMRGMVQVFFPWLQPEGAEKPIMPWARVVQPGAAKGVGMFALPQIGDEVCVGFEHGDIHCPYVLGGLWNGKDPVPAPTTPADGEDMKGNFGGPTRKTPDYGPDALSGDKGANKTEFWRSRSGNLIVLHDGEGDTIRVNDKTGKSSIQIKSGEIQILQRKGDIKVYSQKMTRFDCTDFEVYASNNIEFTAQENFGCKAEANVSMTAGASFKATSKQKFVVNSKCAISVTAGANVNIQGGSKTTMLAVSGNITMLFGGAFNVNAKADSVVTSKAGTLTIIGGAGINMAANGDIKWKAGGPINGFANCINLN